jgi:hypothetical protein
MTNLKKGLILGALQVLIVLSLGAKLLVDRMRLPRVWVQTAAYDPDLPIRGRYLSVRVRVQGDRVYAGTPFPSGDRSGPWSQMRPVSLTAENGQLVASPSTYWGGSHVTRWRTVQGELTVLQEPVAYFIPENAADPSRRQPGEELWIEVTVPKKGPPRPIRLAIKRGDSFTPLDIR